MRSLSFKMFVSFWLVLVAVVGVTMIRVAHEQKNQPPGMEHHWLRASTDALNLYGVALADQVENGRARDVGPEIISTERKTGIRLSLLDENGHPLAGYPLPANAPGLIVHANASNTAMAPTSTANGSTLTEPVASTAGKRYILVAVLSQREFGERPNWHGWPLHVIYDLITYLVIASIACFFLGRYLTRPIKKLQDATRRIAAGDLSARAQEKRGRGDEIDELVKDFNRMAGRIETLIQVQKRLISDISHELRTPLTRLGLALELARKRVPGAETQLDRIELESERLNAMIGQLLSLSSVETENHSRRLEMVQISDVLADLVEDADFEARGVGRSVVLQYSTDCSVLAAPSLLRSAIENVLRNAIRYAPVGSAIEVTSQVTGQGPAGECVIRVRDHGDGVPESELKNMFRPFYRLENDRARDTGGVGLGLSIAERAIIAHGGAIRASNAECGGLEVEIHLPAHSSGRVLANA